jgi:hypothetical protein
LAILNRFVDTDLSRYVFLIENTKGSDPQNRQIDFFSAFQKSSAQDASLSRIDDIDLLDGFLQSSI